MSYECEVKACGDESNKEEITLTVKVSITRLCPCSKEISDYGAHNQRGIAKISAVLREFVWIEELISVAESSAGCDIYSLLKRPVRSM